MAFIVEDGTGVENATSYLTVAFADDYFNTIGNCDWIKLNIDAKQVALNLASQYADLAYECDIAGSVVNEDQGLALPRENLYNLAGKLLEGIPTKWMEAVAEYAILSNKGTLYRTESRDKGDVKSTTRQVGPIRTQTVYQDNTQNATQFLNHTKPDRLVRCLFRARSNSCKVIR